MKNLVLLGAGQAHVELLSALADKPLPGVQITLITPCPLQLHERMMPGFVAGHYRLEDCQIALEPWLKKAGARWFNQGTTALDVDAGTVRLANGSTFGFDWLSIDIGPMQDRRQIEALLPGARELGLFVRPLESFAALWPRVVALGAQRALRLAVLGGDATAIELALAIRQRLPASSVTLLAGGESGVAASFPAGLQRRLLEVLQQRAITLLPDLAVRLQDGQVVLGSGARLACDVPLITIGAQPPAWLSGSGLALDQRGFVAVDAFQRSVSHPHVFAAANVTGKEGRTLAKNLCALLTGSPKRYPAPAPDTVQWLSCGDRRAIASWSGFSVQGRWLWWLKSWLDKRFIKRYRSD